MIQVQPWPKRLDTRQVWSVILNVEKEYDYQHYEMLDIHYDGYGKCVSWQASFYHPLIGIMVLYSSTGRSECSIIHVVYKQRLYSYSDTKWYDYKHAKDLVKIADEFATNLLADDYTGDEYLLDEQDFPDE